MAANRIEKTLHVGLAASAPAVSWLFIQTIFTFIYAHLYHHEEKLDEPDGQACNFRAGKTLTILIFFTTPLW